MEGQVERRYLLARVPVCDMGNGTHIRYGYLKVTDMEFRLYSEDGRFYAARVADAESKEETRIEIGEDAYQLLTLAIKSRNVDQIRFAVLNEAHHRYEIDEENLPKGAYLNSPIVEGRVFTADHGVEIRNIGNICFMASRLTNRPEWNGDDVIIHMDVFTFLWKSRNCKHIEKIRYNITGKDEVTGEEDTNVGNHIWYVDQYFGELSGLVRAKVMLPADSICVPPKTIAKETVKNVTSDVRFRDGYLAKAGLSVTWVELQEFLQH